MSTGAGADTMLPRHSMQLPSPEWSLCCCEADSRWRVQPSGQQIPSIAFKDANTTSIATARNLRTIRLLPASGRSAREPAIAGLRVLARVSRTMIEGPRCPVKLRISEGHRASVPDDAAAPYARPFTRL